MNRIAVAACLLLAGCINPVKYERPAVELPEAWKEAAPRFAEDGRWWRIYDDTALDAVVDEALARNGDLLVAAARVDEARALLGEANSFFWPSVERPGLGSAGSRFRRAPRPLFPASRASTATTARR